MSDATLDLEALLTHADWVRGLARRLVRDAHLADDLAQSAWVAAMETPPAQGRPVRRWLAAVLRSRAFDLRRRASAAYRRESIAAHAEAQPSAHDVVERLATHRRVVEAVAQLDEPYRTAILLRFFEGLPPREIARKTAAPVATVRTRIARGLERLRARLDGLHGGDRRAWCVALAPLAAARDTIFWTSMGVGVVKAKTIGVLALVAAILVAGWFLSAPKGAPESEATPAVAEAPAEAAPAAEVASAAGVDRSRAVAAPSVPGAEKPAAPAASRPPVAAAPSRLRGRVVDLDSRAIAGIELRFRPHASAASAPAAAESDPELRAVSDGEGRFDMDLPGRSGDVEVASPSYTTVLSGAVTPVEAVGELVVVAAPRMTVGGTVVDEAGSPIEKARVRLAPPEGFRGSFRHVLDFSADRDWTSTTDAAGKFEIADAAHVAGAKIHASAAGYETLAVDGPVSSTWSVVLVLRPAEARRGWIRGRVVELAGGPAAEALVSVGGPRLITTDRDGRFDAEVGTSRTLTVVAAKAGCLPAKREIRVDAEGRLDPPEPLVLRLGDRPQDVAGTVVDAAGKPVAEAFVWLEGIGDRTWMGDEYPVVESVVAGRKDAPLVRSDASGAFRIRGLLPRNYRIDAMDAKTLAVGSAEGVAAGRSDVRIAIPANATHARLAGRVESLGGEPLAGIQVRPARMTFHTFRMAYTEDLPLVTTDAQGRFELRDVAREGVFIQAVGESIIPGDVAAPFANPEDVHIVVSRRCHMQVELVDANEGVDGFSVFDADGKRLVIRSFRGPMTISSDSESIDSGRSKVVGVDETAKTMALFRKDKEVRRVPLALKPGELTVVRP